MRHFDIRTTMNVYGDVVDDRTKEAHGKVAALVFRDRSPRRRQADATWHVLMWAVDMRSWKSNPE
jgi:hypothetical protein